MAASGSTESIRRATAAPVSSSRCSRLSSSAWLIASRGCSSSGSDSTSLVKVVSVQLTKPSGAFLRRTERSFLGSSANFARIFAFSTSCSGACATTYPTVSKPARPARPPIWWNSRLRRMRWRRPSNLVSAENSTVRIGTLMPTPSVSVPQITASRPRWARRSTRRR